MRRTALVFVLCTVLADPATPISTSSPHRRPRQVDVVEYSPPTPRPVADPFRPPQTQYSAGNRGIEYATQTGDPVAAIADGIVRFRGVVATEQWVVLEHADGRLSSYGNVLAADFAVGSAIPRGALVGVAIGPVHLGVRERGLYIDPASLWNNTKRHAILDNAADSATPAAVTAHRTATPRRANRCAQPRSDSVRCSPA